VKHRNIKLRLKTAAVFSQLVNKQPHLTNELAVQILSLYSK